MTSREQFEAWFKREIIETPDFEFNTFDDVTGEYVVTEDDNIDLYLQVQAMYMAWQASREAVEVELPTRVDCCNVPFAGYSWNACLEESEKRIRAAGIKVIEREQKNG